MLRLTCSRHSAPTADALRGTQLVHLTATRAAPLVSTRHSSRVRAWASLLASLASVTQHPMRAPREHAVTVALRLLCRQMSPLRQRHCHATHRA